MYKTVLFDLDGTLTDSGRGITNSVMYSLKKYGIDVSDRRELYKFVGPPLVESFQKYYGFSPEKALEATHTYREYYAQHGIFESEVYDGVEEMLSMLKDGGRRLIVATSKPEIFAERVIEHFGLSPYFDYVAGSLMNETRTGKVEVIEYAMEQCGITERSQVIMVGDREQDVIGARKAGIDCIGVLYGFGDRREHENAGARYIAQSPVDVAKIILE